MNQTGSKTRRRAAFFLFFLAAQVMLVAAIWQYHQVLVAVYDDTSSGFFSRFSRGGTSADVLALKSVSAAVFHSNVAGTDDEDPEHRRDLVNGWANHLQVEGFGYRIVTDIARLDLLESFNLLILPGVSAMRDEEMETVKAFLRSGRGVIMDWATGTRDETGEWRSQSLLHHVAGVSLRESPPALENDISALLLLAGSPLTRGLSPGFVLKTRRYEPPLSVRLLEPRVQPAGAWLDAEQLTEHAALGAGDFHERVGLAHGEYMGGRFVWLGYTITSSDNESEQAQAFQTLVRNSIVWAGRQPVAYKDAWPQGSASAFSLSLVVSSPDDVDPRLMALVQQHDLPLTLLIDSESLMNDYAIWGQYAETAELAVLDTSESEDGEMTFKERVRYLKILRNRIQEVSGASQVGYRRGDGNADDRLLDALVRAEYNYISTRGTREVIPVIVRFYRPIRFVTRARELWNLPDRTYEEVAGVSPEVFDALHSMGGYFSLVLRPADITPEFIDELGAMVRRIKKENVWMATAGEVASHWRVWGNLRIATTYTSARRVAIRISNTGLEPVEDVSFYLDFNQPHESLDIRPTTLGTPSLLGTSGDGQRWILHLPSVPPGKNFAYYVSRK